MKQPGSEDGRLYSPKGSSASDAILFMHELAELDSNLDRPMQIIKSMPVGSDVELNLV